MCSILLCHTSDKNFLALNFSQTTVYNSHYYKAGTHVYSCQPSATRCVLNDGNSCRTSSSPSFSERVQYYCSVIIYIYFNNRGKKVLKTQKYNNYCELYSLRAHEQRTTNGDIYVLHKWDIKHICIPVR